MKELLRTPVCTLGSWRPGLAKIAAEKAVGPLLRSIKTVDQWDSKLEFAHKIEDILISFGPDAVPELSTFLSDEDGRRRYCATRVLAKVCDSRALDSLLQALPLLKEIGAHAVGTILAESTNELSHEQLSSVLHTLLQQLSSLGAAGAEAVAKTVTRYSRVLSPDDIRSALRATLNARLSDTDKSVAVSTLIAQDAAPTDLIVRCLYQTERSVLIRAVQILKSRSYRSSNTIEAVAFADAADDWQLLIGIGAPAVAALARRMWNEAEALKALIEIGDSASIDAVVRILSSEGSSWSYQARAAQALCRIGDARCLRPMLEVLTRGHYAFELADDVLVAIQTVFDRAGEQAPDDVVDALASLPTPFRVFYKFEGLHEKFVDTSGIVSAAQAELERRTKP
jgi:HEAT repeat protein